MRGRAEVGPETVQHIKTLFRFCPVSGAPNPHRQNRRLSGRKEAVRAEGGELVEPCPPGPWGSAAPSLEFPDGENLTWLNPFSFRGVLPHTQPGSLPVVRLAPLRSSICHFFLFSFASPPSVHLPPTFPDSCHILSFLQDCCPSGNTPQCSCPSGKPCSRVEAMLLREPGTGLGVPPLQLSGEGSLISLACNFLVLKIGLISTYFSGSLYLIVWHINIHHLL